MLINQDVIRFFIASFLLPVIINFYAINFFAISKSDKSCFIFSCSIIFLSLAGAIVDHHSVIFTVG